MEIIKRDTAFEVSNSEVCKVLEYSFKDKEIDLGVATLNGRYPEKGYCINSVSKELVYVLEGNGNLCFEDKKFSFSAGDSLLIDSGEKYFWETEYCKVAMICTPAWNVEQYRLVD